MFANADMGRRSLKVIGKGGKERHVPVDPAFFAELAAYLRWERPPGLLHRSVSWCCAARPRGAGERSGPAQPVSPPPGALRRHPGPPSPAASHLRDRISRGGHRPAGAAGADGTLLAGDNGVYVHLSVEQLAAEYGAARAALAAARR